MAIEKPNYEVLEKDGDLELRRYEPYIVAETLVETEFDQAGDEGFRRLADYIFGNNRKKQSLGMTAPVSQQASEKIPMTAPVGTERQGEAWRITFMMPSAYTLESLPEPVDPKIQLRQIPASLVAALRYSGTWSHERYREREARLEAWIDKQGWEKAGVPVFARYNPPFTPWFLRRNEVLIPVGRTTEPAD